jgi:NADPH:quinone reductase-like Zn-dependent oxidoreductase
MKAFVVEKYGKSGLRAAHIREPSVGPHDVLVQVSAASINPLDKMIRNGEFTTTARGGDEAKVRASARTRSSTTPRQTLSSPSSSAAHD